MTLLLFKFQVVYLLYRLLKEQKWTYMQTGRQDSANTHLYYKWNLLLDMLILIGAVLMSLSFGDIFLLKSYSFFKNAFLKSSKVKNASKKFIRQHEFFSANPHPNLAAANLNFKISLNQLVVATLIFKWLA